MKSRFIARLAARRSPRFKAYVEAQDAYESFLQTMEARFDQMSEEHYRRARQEPRLEVAERGFALAMELSERAGALTDVAVAKYQLGLVRHALGELDEAEALMRAAAEVFSSLPGRERMGDSSACYYHLGVIALKRGRLDEAVRQLRLSRQIDEALGDLGGAQLCSAALATCAEAGADIEADIKPAAPPSADHPTPWDAADGPPEVAAEGESEPDVTPESVSYNRRELICLASYSIQANDALMEHLNSLGNEFGRPVGVSRVAYGAADLSQRHLPKPEPDQHLCAAILVLERAGLSNRAFREFAFACMERVVAVPDFRLLVYLYDLGWDELQTLADSHPFIEELFETTQIDESPSLENLRRTLVPYLRRAERVTAAAVWRNLRLKLASQAGQLAQAVLIAGAVLALLGLPAWLLKPRLDWLEPHGPRLAALIVGMLAFPVQAPLIFLLLRGMRATMMAPRDNAFLRQWVVIGGIILFGASYLQHALAGPNSWVWLGVALGVLLDSIRRAGRQARREMIDLKAKRELASDPDLRDPSKTVLGGDPVNPFSCPLLPALSARVFISYARSSARASRLAATLYRELKQAGASPFLDRASIPAGESWGRTLNQHLGACNVFLCILDEKGVQKEWVAAELLAALEGHRLTGVPDIMIFVDPQVQPSQPMLPVFAGVLSASASPQLPGRPQVRLLNAQTQSSLVWGLAHGKFASHSVLTSLVAGPIMLTVNLLAYIARLGFPAGYVLGFLVMAEGMAKLPFTSRVSGLGLSEPLAFLCAFWLGSMARATIAWGGERDHGRPMGTTLPAIATCGIAYALVMLIQKVSFLSVSWSVVLVILGWLMVSSTVRAEVAGRGARGQ